MPDLVTHIAFASFFADRKYRWVFFLLFGAILTDVTRLFFLLFESNYEAYWFFYVMHSPFIALLVVLLLSFLFSAKIRRIACLWMLLGVATHLALDALQIHFSKFSYPWIFPFSMEGSAWGLFWPEDPLYVAPFIALAAIVFFLIRKYKLNKTKCKMK